MSNALGSWVIEGFTDTVICYLRKQIVLQSMSLVFLPESSSSKPIHQDKVRAYPFDFRRVQLYCTIVCSTFRGKDYFPLFAEPLFYGILGI
ncbi:hypothetical protein BU200_06305 [Streptococcus acidominimus]|uniref:Uncharacterized protein n=1 Tax=Streptococcus acidominimus TaxID=1326 RepID=A0A1Q8ECU3_STRAI|nr:hypothetical protein BU200_06305 [Streptococcus acidominimus]